MDNSVKCKSILLRKERNVNRTFNLPDLYDRHILYRTGTISGTKGDGSVPSFTGDFALATGVNGTGTWLKADYTWGAVEALASGNTAVLSQSSTFTGANKFRINPALQKPDIYKGSSVYGRHLQLNAIIKYI